VYFNVNFNVFFKVIKVHFLVSELYIYYAYTLQTCRKKFVDFWFCFTSFFMPVNQLLKIDSSTLKQVSYHYFHWWRRSRACLFEVWSLSDIYVRMSLGTIIQTKY